jgi:spoIIIJ-associated protein
MSERKRRFFSGPTLEAALVSAASEYGIPPEQVNYRVLEKRHGFLKVRRNVVIEVDPETAVKSEAPATAQTAPGRDSPEARSAKPRGADEERHATQAVDEPVEEREAAPRKSGSEAPESGRKKLPGVVDDRPPLRPRRRGEGGPVEAQEEESEGPEERKKTGGRGAKRGEAEPASRRRGRRREEPERVREEDREPGRGEGREVGRRRRPRQEPPKPIEERLEKAQGEKAEAALEATEWLLDLVDVDVDAEVYEGEDRFEVELRGPDRELLIPDNGKVLSALEHLIPRVMRGVCGDAHPVRVDSENFQEQREDRLRELAWDMADKVRREGQATILEAMDPADRRIVHIAISDDPDVTTRSLGDGFFKRVKVLPK